MARSRQGLQSQDGKACTAACVAAACGAAEGMRLMPAKGLALPVLLAGVSAMPAKGLEAVGAPLRSMRVLRRLLPSHLISQQPSGQAAQALIECMIPALTGNSFQQLHAAALQQNIWPVAGHSASAGTKPSGAPCN